MKNIKFPLVGLFLTLLMLVWVSGSSYANTVPGTIYYTAPASPVRSCTIDTVWGTSWPQYNCQENSGAGCKIYYNNATLTCNAGNVSNTTSPNANCSNSSSSLCAGSCTSVSNYSCRNSSTLSASCAPAACASGYSDYGYTASYTPSATIYRTCAIGTSTPGNVTCNNVNTVAACTPGSCSSGYSDGGVTTSTTPGGTNTRTCSYTFSGTTTNSNTTCNNASTVSSCTPGSCASGYTNYGYTSSSTPGATVTRTCTLYGTSYSYPSCTNNANLDTACVPGTTCGSWSQTALGTSTTPGATNTRTCQTTTYPDSTTGGGTAKTCSNWYTVPTIYNYITKQRYSDNLNQPFQFGGSNLGNNAANTCTVSAFRDAYPALWYLAPTTEAIACERAKPGSGLGATVYGSYTGGADGTCRYENTNYIFTYDQLVGKLLPYNPQPSGTLRQCLVMWLSAVVDDTGPSIVVNNVSNVFNADTTLAEKNSWCNYTKYVASDYGTATNPTLAGCEFYKNKVTSPSTNVHPDLLENLEIKVDDVSGISQVKIEIGKCTAIYDMATIINQVAYITSAAYGTNPLLKNLTFHYNALSTSAEPTPTVAGPVTGGATPNPSGVGLPSLKTKLAGGGRLDSCLAEGKNYIRVTAMDDARQNWDGVSYSPNSSSFSYESYSKFIKIDNTGARIGLSGEAAKIFESNAPLGAFAGGGVTLSPYWKNYTITGNIKSTDPFGNDDTTNAPPACSPYTSTGQTCTVNGSGVPKPNAAGVIWKAPQGVNPSNGTFTAIKCGNLESLPRMSACDWGCADGYSYDSVTNSCLTTVVTPVCKADGTAPCIAGPSVAPVISYSRTCNGTNCTTVNPGDTQTVSWSILDATSVSWICDTAPGNTTQNVTSYKAPETMTYTQIIANGWTPGYHHCTMTASGPGGTTSQDISVTIGSPYACPADLACKAAGGCTLTYNANAAGLSWTANAPSCGYVCKPNYSGTNCTTYTAPTYSCPATEPACKAAGGCTLTYNANTSGLNWGKDNANCGFTCKANYSGANCETYTAPSYSCPATEPACKAAGGCTLTYNATALSTTWTKDALSCGFACQANYSGNTCQTYTPPYVAPSCTNACVTYLNWTGCTDANGAPTGNLTNNPWTAGAIWSPASFVNPTMTCQSWTRTPDTIACELSKCDVCGATKTWTKDGNTCTGVVGNNAASGTNTYADDLDSSDGFSGGAIYSCTNGVLTELPQFTTCDPPAPVNSCTTTPTFANIGTTTTGSPTSVGQAWTYNTTPGNCTYTCTNGYSGTNCATAPVADWTSFAGKYTGSIKPWFVGSLWTIDATGLIKILHPVSPAYYPGFIGAYTWLWEQASYCTVDSTGKCTQTFGSYSTSFTVNSAGLSTTWSIWTSSTTDGWCASPPPEPVATVISVSSMGPVEYYYHKCTQGTWVSCHYIDGWYVPANTVDVCDNAPIPVNSCAAAPTFANVGTTTTGSPTSVGQAWTYSATPGTCTYACTGGYSGTNCTTAPPVTLWTMKYAGKAFGVIEPTCFDGAMTSYFVVNNDGSLGSYVSDYDGYEPVGFDMTWMDRWIQYRTGSPWTQTTYISNIKHKFQSNQYPDASGKFIETGAYGTVEIVDGGNNSINIVYMPGTPYESITNYGNHPIVSPYRCNYTPISLTIGVG